MKDLAMYAGTFDPLTLGHMDLIDRACNIFRRLILAISIDSSKKTLFSVEERAAMAQEAVSGINNVEVVCFDRLLVDYARARGVQVLIRGLRSCSDLEYEFQMALTNRKLAPEVETLFMMPKEIYSYISSSAVKEIAMHGGDITGFVPAVVVRELVKKFRT